MMFRIAIALITLLLPFAVEAAAPTALIAASRTTGVAPLCVQFDGSGSTDADMIATNEEFYGLSYLWNFGDSGSGNHTNGAVPSSKNQSFDPITGHCFETAATYTVTLQVFDGTTLAQDTETIIVSAADTQWATTKTTCVSATSSFTGCPTGATQQTTLPTITSDMRLLINGGETFTGPLTVDATDTGPGYIGSYGTGRATISVTGTNKCFSVAATDWRIVDLICTGDGSTSGEAVDLAAGGTKNTIKNVKFTGFGANVGYVPNIINYLSESSGTDLFLTESELSGQNATTGAVNIYTALTRGVIMDNLISGDDTQFQNLRLHADSSVISNNTLTGGGKSGSPTESIAIRAQNAVTRSKVVVSGNKVTLGSTYTGTGIKVSVTSGETGKVTDALIQRNWILSAGSGGGREGIKVGGDRVVVRNNIIDMSGGITFGVVLSDVDGSTTGTDSNDLLIYNNTFYSSTDVTDGGSTFTAVYVQSGTAPATSAVVNNIAYAPLPSGVTTRTLLSGSVTTALTNSTGSSGTNEIMAGDGTTGTPVSPFANGSGSMNTPADFRIKATSYAIDGGTDSFPSSHRDFYNCKNGINADDHYGAFVPAARAICFGAN